MDVSEAQAQFEAMMLRPALQPILDAFGEYGDIVADEFTQVLAKRLSP
jgi:hypothetical protein